MVQAKPRFKSFEEYLRYDDETDRRYELVAGELVELPTESPINILITTALLLSFVQMGISIQRIGIKHQIAVKSSKVTAREPDLIIHSEESASAILRERQALLTLEMPVPALVVEVVSPGDKNHKRDYVDKRSEYASRGIPEYWLIDPEDQNITILKLSDGAYVESGVFEENNRVISPTFPELQLTAEQILEAGR